MYGNNNVARKTLLAHVNQQFSVGVNQIVWHGWADQSPGAATSWPGFSPFGSFISDVYGPQNPTFADDVKVNTYVGRMQAVLRRGNLRNDVAIYRDDRGHSLDGSTADLYFTDQSLARAGYSYGFMNNTLVNSPTASVSGGRLNASELGYKAFVLDNTKNTNTNPTLDLASAKKILAWAKSGLPIVVVGTLPDRVRGNHPGRTPNCRPSTAPLLAQPTACGSRRPRTGVSRRCATPASEVRPPSSHSRPRSCPCTARPRTATTTTCSTPVTALDHHTSASRAAGAPYQLRRLDRQGHPDREVHPQPQTGSPSR